MFQVKIVRLLLFITYSARIVAKQYEDLGVGRCLDTQAEVFSFLAYALTSVDNCYEKCSTISLNGFAGIETYFGTMDYCYCLFEGLDEQDTSGFKEGLIFDVDSGKGKVPVVDTDSSTVYSSFKCYVPPAPTSTPTLFPTSPQDPYFFMYKYYNTTSNGLTLNYDLAKNILKEQLNAKIMDESCTDNILDDSVVVSNISIKELHNIEYNIAQVPIDVDTTKIKESTVWDSLSDEDGVVKFCVKSEVSDPSYDMSSITFSETKVHLNINFEAGFVEFTLDDIKLHKDEASVIEQTNQVTASACLCSEADICIEDPHLEQNAAFRVCIKPDSDLYEVVSFKEMSILQDNTAKFLPVIDGTPSSSITTLITGPIGIVETRIITTFFEGTNPSDVSISGEVILDFLSENSERMLKVKDIEPDSQETASFNLNISLKKSLNGNAFHFDSFYVAIIVMQIVIAMFFFMNCKNDVSDNHLRISAEATAA